LFAGFPATTTGSDFSGSCINGYDSSSSHCGPAVSSAGRTRDLPVSARRASAHARVFDHAGSNGCSRSRPRPYCLPRCRARRHPVLPSFRGSVAGLCMPLPTLHRHPLGCQCTARGRCGSLIFHRSGLTPPALRRLLRRTDNLGENSCCLIREGCPLQTVASVEMFPLPRLLKCHGRIAKTDRMLRGPYPTT
jgi:hypothetical protein